jgi:hypothetical protein
LPLGLANSLSQRFAVCVISATSETNSTHHICLRRNIGLADTTKEQNTARKDKLAVGDNCITSTPVSGKFFEKYIGGGGEGVLGFFEINRKSK